MPSGKNRASTVQIKSLLNSFLRKNKCFSSSNFLLNFLIPFVCLLMGVSSEALAATVSASPTSCVSVAGIGTVAWTNPSQANLSDNSYATASVDGTTTRYVRCTGYNFAIPAGATIDGITVNVERRSSSVANGGSRDAAVRIVKAGVIGTADRSTATAYTAADVIEAHGSAADLWGTTWTSADINSINFGASYAATKPSAAGAAHTIRLDHIQITISYTPIAGTYSATASPTACASVNWAGGNRPWSSPIRASASDNSYTTATVDGTTTRYLQCTGYNFAIPTGATINGITVNVERKSNSVANGGSRDAAMRVVKANVIGTADRSTTTLYTTADVVEAHGGISDLWSTIWTPAQINAANFGAAFASTKLSSAGAAHTISVDHMPITVTYTIGAVGPDHIRITHGGSGLTCSPVLLTVIACANAACTAPHFTGSAVTGSVTWAGVPGGSVPFNIIVGGTTQLGLPVTTVQTVTLGTTAVSPAPVSASDCINSGGGSACSLSFADSGLMLNVPNHVAETSQNITISAVRKADNAALCVPAFASVTRAINVKCVYTNPGSGTLAVRVGGSALNAANSAAAACDGTGRSVNFAFDATGIATGTLQYADVGQMTLNATYTGSGATGDAGLSMTGTGSFIAAPASFAFSNITPVSVFKAGSVYNASITARNASNTATPNFGKETAPEGVTLSPNLVAPVGGNNPAIGNNIILGSSFTSGVASLTNLSWGEVGLITMTAKLTNPTYLGTTFTASGISGNVGPFIPDHFDTMTSGGMTCPVGLTCPAQFNGFVYSGQALSTQVKAYNLGGTVTQNYDSTFAYSKAVTLSAMNSLGGATTNPAGGTLTMNTLPATAFSLGVANTSTPVYTFPVSLTAPTDIYIRAIDTDSVSSLRTVALNSIEGGMTVVSGRSKISNAYGSELLPLTLTVNVQLWNGTNWVNSTTDGATQFNTSLSPAGNIVPIIVTGPLALGNISVKTPATVTVVAGVSTFTLNKPSVTGSVDLSLNTPSYLYTGSNNAAVNPAIPGRATFGVYSGNPNLIYQREAY